MYPLPTSLLPKRILFKTVAQFKMHTVEYGSLEFKGDDNELCQADGSLIGLPSPTNFRTHSVINLVTASPLSYDSMVNYWQ